MNMLRKVTLMFLGVFAGLLIVEAVLRAGGAAWPRTMNVDPVRGPVRRPGQVWEQGDEGGAVVQINRFGFRDREWNNRAPAGTIRIAVVGDSYVEAVQVDETRRFTAVLENELRMLVPDLGAIEIMNFGISGHGTGQELVTYRTVVRSFQPDYVILAFMTGNDILDNVRTLSGDPFRPYFCLVNGRLGCGGLTTTLKDTLQRFFTRASFLLVDHSRCAQAINRTWRARRGVAFHESISSRRDTKDEATSLAMNWYAEAFREPQTSQWIGAWELTQMLIKTFHEEVEQSGAQFVLVSVGSSIEAHPDLQVRDTYCKEAHLPHLNYPRLRLKDISQQFNIDYLDLAQAFADSAATTGNYYHGFPNTALGMGHWNETGHQLAGSLLASALRQRIQSDRLAVGRD
jgi:hypothetical protein